MRELLFMKPYCREVIWGGRQLKQLYGYETEGEHTGEAWVVSGNAHGASTVSEGIYAGQSLAKLWTEHRELFGNLEGDSFPLLVKLIDARQHLSIQVHPDDAYAQAQGGDAAGKTECWYIVRCEPGADIVIGHTAKNKTELSEKIEAGDWGALIQPMPIHAGDFFYIPAGTVHAIRQGTLLLEIQQNSDTTYRMYDYGRLEQGKPRQLHLKESLDVVYCPQSAAVTQTAGAVEQFDGYSRQQLVSSPFFTVERIALDGTMQLSQPYAFMTVSVTEGSGSVNGRSVRAGEHWIAPCGCEPMELCGRLELVTARLS